jgi:peptide-methionine (S)-S-oxide reductase
MRLYSDKLKMPTKEEALPGREQRPVERGVHAVLGTPLSPPYPDGLETVEVGMGCFWGAERKFWEADGVHVTAVGYQGGFTRNPTYEEVCTGLTGHTEVVRVVWDPRATSLAEMLRIFWENHDPTQGMRQGNDVGTQYRSAVFVSSEAALAEVERSRDAYQAALSRAGLGSISTEIRLAPEFYFAEDYHQQYLAKNPWGYCGLGGTGVSCPTGAGVELAESRQA